MVRIFGGTDEMLYETHNPFADAGRTRSPRAGRRLARAAPRRATRPCCCSRVVQHDIPSLAHGPRTSSPRCPHARRLGPEGGERQSGAGSPSRTPTRHTARHSLCVTHTAVHVCVSSILLPSAPLPAHLTHVSARRRAAAADPAPLRLSAALCSLAHWVTAVAGARTRRLSSAPHSPGSRAPAPRTSSRRRRRGWRCGGRRCR